MVVIEVLEHTADSMNGQKFERYKLRAEIEGNITITTGFARAGLVIKNGDIVEHMQVVGRVTASKLCELHYAIQEQQKQIATHPAKRTEVIPIIKKNKKQEKQRENVQLSLF